MLTLGGLYAEEFLVRETGWSQSWEDRKAAPAAVSRGEWERESRLNSRSLSCERVPSPFTLTSDLMSEDRWLASYASDVGCKDSRRKRERDLSKRSQYPHENRQHTHNSTLIRYLNPTTTSVAISHSWLSFLPDLRHFSPSTSPCLSSSLVAAAAAAALKRFPLSFARSLLLSCHIPGTRTITCAQRVRGREGEKEEAAEESEVRWRVQQWYKCACAVAVSVCCPSLA